MMISTWVGSGGGEGEIAPESKNVLLLSCNILNVSRRTKLGRPRNVSDHLQ